MEGQGGAGGAGGAGGDGGCPPRSKVAGPHTHTHWQSLCSGWSRTREESAAAPGYDGVGDVGDAGGVGAGGDGAGAGGYVGGDGGYVGVWVGDCSGGESCGGTLIPSAWLGCPDLPGRKTSEPGEAGRRRAGAG